MGGGVNPDSLIKPKLPDFQITQKGTFDTTIWMLMPQGWLGMDSLYHLCPPILPCTLHCTIVWRQVRFPELAVRSINFLLHIWHWVLLRLALNFCTGFSQVQVHVNRRSSEAMNGEDLLYLYIAHLFWYAPAFKKLPLYPFFTLVEVMRITGSLNFS